MAQIRRAGLVLMVALTLGGAASASAATDPVAALERTLIERYPAVAGPLLGSSPYRTRPLRVIYVSGAVSVWFQRTADRRALCAAARANSPQLQDAITGQLMPSADAVRLWASRGVSPARGVDVFRRGILRACKLRGG